jgi:hypothetical protein
VYDIGTYVLTLNVHRDRVFYHGNGSQGGNVDTSVMLNGGLGVVHAVHLCWGVREQSSCFELECQGFYRQR